MKSNYLFLCLLAAVFQVNAGALRLSLYACGKNLVKNCFAATSMPHRLLSTTSVLCWDKKNKYYEDLHKITRENEEKACYEMLDSLRADGDHRRCGLTRMVFDVNLSLKEDTKKRLMEAVKKTGMLKKVCVALDKDAAILDRSSIPCMAIMRLPLRSPLIVMNKAAQDIFNQTNPSSPYDHEHAVSIFFHELGHLVGDNIFLMGLTEAFCSAEQVRAIMKNSEYNADAYVAYSGGVDLARKMQDTLKLDPPHVENSFSIHPSSEDRIKRLEEIIKKIEKK